MTNGVIDNTDAGSIKRTILWQYEHAPHIREMLLSFHDFFKASTTDLYDRLPIELNLSDENIGDYGLSVWGDILGVRRPILTYRLQGASEETSQPMSRELYRKILLGRLRLSERDASVPSYIEFVTFVFNGNVSVVDGIDMSISFIENGELNDEEYAAISQCPDVVFMLPSGVRDNEHSNSKMFVLDGQEDETEFSTGGLDQSGFNWRLTPKGNWR